MKRIAWMLLVVFALTLTTRAAELDALIGTRAELWTFSGDAIQQNVPDVFKWVDASKARLRYNVLEGETPLTLFGVRAQEVIIEFSEEKPVLMSVSFYNRGDVGDITKKVFEQFLEKLQERIVNFIGSDIKPESQNVSAGGARIRSLIWRTDTGDALLRWSVTRQRSEFIILDLYPPGKAPVSLRDSFKTSVGSTELTENVQQDDDGSCYLLIPMVDQGAKGYCVAATVERVLRYYGSNVDQHVIAKLAESDAERGTNLNKIVDVLGSNQSRLGIRHKELYRYDELDSYDAFRRLCDAYNTVARRAKKPRLKLDDYTFTIDRVRYLEYGRLMKALDFSVFSELRAKERRASRDFIKQVQGSVDEGMPLCWSTFIFPGVEESQSEFGMHMRLITGYNLKTNEIIYSDSWGAGHEKKKMKVEAAWGITVNLLSLEPRRRSSR